jgi:hypothetical protein
MYADYEQALRALDEWLGESVLVTAGHPDGSSVIGVEGALQRGQELPPDWEQPAGEGSDEIIVFSTGGDQHGERSSFVVSREQFIEADLSETDVGQPVLMMTFAGPVLLSVALS